jgi:hypothetical protein
MAINAGASDPFPPGGLSTACPPVSAAQPGLANIHPTYETN